MVKRLGEWVLAIDGTSLPEKSLVGGNAWSIAEMSALGLHVPPACVITTRARDEDAHLRRIASWAGELSRIPIMAVHAGGEALDFDDHSENVRNLAQIIRPGNIVKGRIFSNDDSLVRIAIERGAASIVTSPVLPALLAAAHAAQETGKPE
ncbi:MAG TPA: hypothetical protein VN325_01465 [Steroidobacteraceae bacterium]|nr:hypothetical protein [Steroidobacteraceae bacterium]